MNAGIRPISTQFADLPRPLLGRPAPIRTIGQRDFDPRSIPGLAVWLDVTNTASLTFNGTSVSRVNDLSGNGFHATQTTTSLQPTYLARGFNGLPAVISNGSSIQCLIPSATVSDLIQTPTTTPRFTLIAAWHQLSIADSGQVAWSSTDLAAGRLFFATFFGGTTLLLDAPTVPGSRLTGAVAEANYIVPMIHTAYRHGATMAVRRSGVVDAIRTNASGVYSVMTSTVSLMLGGASIMSEVLWYASALTPEQIRDAEGYLARKYAVSVT